MTAASSPKGPTGRRLWRDPRLWLGAAFSLFLIWLSFRGADWGRVGEALRRLDPLVCMGALLLTPAILWLRARRWGLLLHPLGPVAPARVTGAMVLGYTLNYAFPIRAGEIARAWLVGGEGGISRSAAMATVIVERILDILSILAIFVLAVPGLDPARSGEGLMGPVWSGILVLALVGILASLSALLFHHRAEALVVRIGPWLERVLPRLATQLWRIPAFSKGLDLGRGMHGGLLFLTLVIWAGTLGQMYWLATGLDLTLPWAGVGMLVVALAVGVSMPSAPGMLGTFHYPAILVLTWYGAPRPDALAYALVLHALSVIPVLLWGGWVAVRHGRSLARLWSGTGGERP